MRNPIVFGFILIGFFSLAPAATVHCKGSEHPNVSLEIHFSKTISAKMKINNQSIFAESLRQSESAWFDEVVELVSVKKGDFRFAFDRYSAVSCLKPLAAGQSCPASAQVLIASGSFNYFPTSSTDASVSFSQIDFSCNQVQFLQEFYNTMFSLN